MMAIESKAWLHSIITVEEFETSHKTAAFSLTEDLYQSSLQKWEQFKQKITPGDELWSYSGGMGNIGIVLMRNGEIVEDFVMMER
jgi:hypothetical protein